MNIVGLMKHSCSGPDLHSEDNDDNPTDTTMSCDSFVHKKPKTAQQVIILYQAMTVAMQLGFINSQEKLLKTEYKEVLLVCKTYLKCKQLF